MEKNGLPYTQPEQGFSQRALYRGGYDPRSVLRWGQMQAIALLEVLKAAERRFGDEGQQVCIDAIVGVGRKVGRDIAEAVKANMPQGLSDVERAAFFTSYINRNVYASPEVVTILSDDEYYFDILWCPHQDIYSARDCRLQRYFVQGIMEGAASVLGDIGGRFRIEIPKIIPRGDDVCRFHLHRLKEGEQAESWDEYSRKLAERELRELQSGRRQRLSHPSSEA